MTWRIMVLGGKYLLLTLLIMRTFEIDKARQQYGLYFTME